MQGSPRACTIGGPFGRGLVRIQTQLRLRRPRNHRGYHLNQYALDHMHSAGPNQWPAEQGRVEPRRPRVAQYMFVPVESRAGSGSARSRLPDEESPSRPRAKLLVKEWHAEKQNVGEADLDARGRQVVLYRLADICTALTRQYRGAVGDVARALGGSLVAPPVVRPQYTAIFRRPKRLQRNQRLDHAYHEGGAREGSPRRRGAGQCTQVRQPP